jgi:putative NADPH-quinone reductase
MPRHVAIIQGHPDPGGGRLCHALANAYADGASEAGHEISRIDIAQIDFPLLRTQIDFMEGTVPPSLGRARDALIAADHVVFVFPLWLGTMPALVKAFLEQVMRPGVAFEYQENGLPKKLLSGRSARLVVTMGMPVAAYRWFFFEHGLKGLERNVLHFVGIKPIRETLFGSVQSASESRRRGWLHRMKEMGRKAA